MAQTVTVTKSNFSRPIPKIGHMLNYLTKPSWRNRSFIDSVKALNLELIRFPGGTESQYFDWQTGRSVPASLWTNGTLFSHSFIGTVPHVSYPLTELLYFYQQTGIKPIFCLNLLTKNLANQVLMLQTAHGLGIPVEYIELGNELYFEDIDFTNKYSNPIDYVLDIKNNWLPQLKNTFPNAKIAVIGSYDGLLDLNGNNVASRINTWNSTLFNQSLQANAITFHYYIPPNTTTLSNPNITQALAAPFRHWPTLKTNTVDKVVNEMECWITEYNLTDGNQTTYSIASSWVHGLYTASLFSLMLEEPKITMILNHQIAGSPAFASLASYTPFGDTLTNRLTAGGNAMRLLHKSVKGKTTATKLSFSNNNTLVVGSTTYPALIGWIFEKGNEKEVFVLNLSNTNITLDLSNIFNEIFIYEQISASNPLQKNISTQNLTIKKGGADKTLQSLAYSLTSATNTIVITDSKNTPLVNSKAIHFYPNPTSDKVNIELNSSSSNQINYTLIDQVGKVVLSGKVEENTIDLSKVAQGTYILRISSQGELIDTQRIIKE